MFNLTAAFNSLTSFISFICLSQLNLDAVQPLAERILAQYREQVADPSNLQTIMATNQAYSMAKTPVLEVPGGVVPNPAHRVVQDDIPHGLCVLKVSDSGCGGCFSRLSCCFLVKLLNCVLLSTII
jgi:hypothetical protein